MINRLNHHLWIENVILYIVVVSFLSIFCTQAQEIKIEKHFLSNNYIQEGKVLNRNELTSVLQDNSEAYKLIKSANNNTLLSNIMLGIGLGVASYSTIRLLIDKEYVYTYSSRVIDFVGLGITLVSIPITNNANSKIEKAVWIYNQNQGRTINQFKSKLYLKINRKSLGLTLNF